METYAAEDIRWLTPEQASHRTGIAVGTLANWRASKEKAGPAFVRIGRIIRYDQAVLDSYMAAHTVAA